MVRAIRQPKVVSIVAGGELHRRFLPVICASTAIIGVDRGAWWLISEGVTPDVAIGDFDSVTTAQKKRIHSTAKKYIEYLPEKNMTDLELAVEEAIYLRPDEVRLYGVLGRRFDHSLGAVQLLTKLVSHNIKGVIVDNFNKIYIVRRQLMLTKQSELRYASVIPFDSDAVVSLKGFRYDVSKKKFIIGSSLGISNEIVDHVASIHVHHGTVLVMQSTD